MPPRVHVGPPIITIHHGDTFLVSGLDGQVMPGGQQGFFCKDTRLVCVHRHFISGQGWVHATSSAENHGSAQFCFVSPEIRTRSSKIAAGTVELRMHRTVADLLYETLTLTNYGCSPVRFHFEIEIVSDFADLFDVKQGLRVDRGQIETSWDELCQELHAEYANETFFRAFSYRLHHKQKPAKLANGRIRFEVSLAPKELWQAQSYLLPIFRRSNKRTCGSSVPKSPLKSGPWSASSIRLDTTNADMGRAFAQALADVGSLRLYEKGLGANMWVAAAGLPWFATIFGRDSLITSLESMIVAPELAKGTLKQLAALQARRRDDWRDAQPGKIIHEVRRGELAELNKVPHARYYGTADATLLYVILLSETFRWTKDERLVRKYRGTAMRCLAWADRYGDLDGDGFQEYKTFSAQGYHNMSWKDAGDAVVYPDGSQVAQPIATCELQGYLYDAKTRMAELMAILGDDATAQELSAQASRLKAQFNDKFWMEREGTYAFALDPEKKLVRSIASNAGHLLWSGILADRERARRVINRLLQPDMFSGWGIRTLSAKNPAYNPHSYQRGSVWPHDNALIAAGAKRYGLHEEANRIIEGLFAACCSFQNYQLPELFAGIERESGVPPVQYIGANVPQAWASASLFLMMQTILGINLDAHKRALRLSPTLPRWLTDVALRDLPIAGGSVSLLFRRIGDTSQFEVIDNHSGVEVIEEACFQPSPA